KTLVLTVEVTDIEHAEQILEWLYAPEKPMKSQLTAIAWDSEVVPRAVRNALNVLGDSMVGMTK
ncbi:MAG: hypothetical protein AAGI44_18250, partial [Pseudomonadota bacterium]